MSWIITTTLRIGKQRSDDTAEPASAGGSGDPIISNPKFEIRSSKQIQMIKMKKILNRPV
jgi:hypothetical protein